ncbi:phloem protein 2-like protein [Tanacetum coccineum]
MSLFYSCIVHSAEYFMLSKVLCFLIISQLSGSKTISLEEVKTATNQFNDDCVIGSGTLGTIYKGELSCFKKYIPVAVKRLHKARIYKKGAFLKEAVKLSRYVHENIITLRGFCEEEYENIIIMDHAINGSLDKHLNNSILTWGHRLKISIGAAKGLNHIHSLEQNHKTVHVVQVFLQTDQVKRPTMALVLYRELGKAFKIHVRNIQHMKIPFEEIRSTLGFTIPHKTGKVYKADLSLFNVDKYVAKNEIKRVSMEEMLEYPRIKSTVAIKSIDGGYGQRTEELLHMLLYHSHENVVKLVGFCDDDDECIHLVYDFVWMLPWAQLSPLSGVNGMTTMIIIHGNIKSSNILEEVEGRPTMADIVKELEEAYIIHVESIELRQTKEDVSKMENLKHLKIPFKEIYSATNGFVDSRRIGWGGFGGVYTAELFHVGKKESVIELYGYPRSKGKVALKRREITSYQGRKEFWEEIDARSGYVDPKYLKEGILSKQSDMYSFGVVLLEVLFGEFVKPPVKGNFRAILVEKADQRLVSNQPSQIIGEYLRKDLENEKFLDSVKTFAAITHECLHSSETHHLTMALTFLERA